MSGGTRVASRRSNNNSTEVVHVGRVDSEVVGGDAARHYRPGDAESGRLFYNYAVPSPILATKLYHPRPRDNAVVRPRLIGRLNEGARRTLTLVCAPAGFGKTTLLSEWGTTYSGRLVWLSLDEDDNDPTRFWSHVIAALQPLTAHGEAGLLAALQTPQPPPIESILTSLLNDLSSVQADFVLVLDDYHAADVRSIDQALTFLLDHLPRSMHVIIATREDPQLPLARYRARDQLIELRAAELRFTAEEAAEFLNHSMGLGLSSEDTLALETRTEGWIVGLQLAALALQGPIAMQGLPDTTAFIRSFSGSHRFILDYLLEEVLHKQPAHIQDFLLRTSILEHLCGPLCEAVLLEAAGSGQATLEYLERANLFIIPLDNERRWYRYHQLFGDLLRQRLQQSGAADRVTEWHVRASQWYEAQGLYLEAFHHATAANDVARAERLIDGDIVPRHFRGAVAPILSWLESLPKSVLDARPSLWRRQAALLLVNGQTAGVEEKLQAAEAALQGVAVDDKVRNLIGQIASARATLALTRYQIEAMLTQAQRALEFLDPNSRSSRANANWVLGYAYLISGNRTAAHQAFDEAVALSQAAGDVFTTILAAIGLGNVLETENQLRPAAQAYQRALELAGEPPMQVIYEARLGLARIHYEWNDLDSAERYGQQSLELARQYETVIDRFITCEVFLARLKLARGDVDGAAAIAAEADRTVRERQFVHRTLDVAAAQVLTLLRQGNLAAADQLSQAHALPLARARVLLAQGNPAAALAVLEPLRLQVETRNLQDERLKVLVLQAIAYQAHGDDDRARQTLGVALALAEPGGFIRLFIDEGEPLRHLLSAYRARLESRPHIEGQGSIGYADRLLAAFAPAPAAQPAALVAPLIEPLNEPLNEPLTARELEVLQLIAQGLSNREIGERLFLALSTVKGHASVIFDKLHVQRRTEAIARARELGLL